MNSQPAPFSAPFDLGSVSDRGVDTRVEPNAEQRKALAEWLGATSVERLEATIRITRPGHGHYRYDAKFLAELTQACVVTLAPVPAHLTGSFTREYYLGGRAAPKMVASPKTKELININDDEPEVLDGSVLDLAAPVLEELTLALDPYPRAPGVSFMAPEEAADPAENPFAVLEKLKRNPSKTPKKPAGPAKGHKH